MSQTSEIEKHSKIMRNLAEIFIYQENLGANTKLGGNTSYLMKIYKERIGVHITHQEIKKALESFRNIGVMKCTQIPHKPLPENVWSTDSISSVKEWLDKKIKNEQELENLIRPNR
tara:strand:- start:165 stop:512 length:348 start_codon:yes stop_codon:yes gene_type:complete